MGFWTSSFLSRPYAHIGRTSSQCQDAPSSIVGIGSAAAPVRASIVSRCLEATAASRLQPHCCWDRRGGRRHGTDPALSASPARRGGIDAGLPSALRLLQFLTREGPSRSKATRLRSRRPKERAGPPVWGSRCRVTAHRRGLRQGLGGHLRQPVFTGVSNTVPASSSNEAKRAAQ